MTQMTMEQTAPYPTLLAALVEQTVYKDGWQFSLDHNDRGQGSEGLTLSILVTNPDAYHPERRRSVIHYMIVPAAAYDVQSWQRWLFDQILAVERHESCEFFQIGERRPYAPNHGPGRDPYTVFDYATDTDRRTSFRGEINE